MRPPIGHRFIGPMIVQSFRERRPFTALERHVTCVWVQEVARDSAPYLYRTVPNGSAELVCAIGSTPRIVGPQTGPTEQVLPPGTTVAGVRFRPGAAPSVLGMPASELVDLDIGAEDVWGPYATVLGDALAGAGSAHDAAALLEKASAARLADAPGPDPLALAAVHGLVDPHARAVRSLASSLFISERQLRRRCEAAIGLAPKPLQRMLRFQRFLALAGTLEQPSAELARLAADGGYEDQPHLTRESMRLAGRPPKAVLVDSERHCGCAHDHAASYTPLLRAA